MEANGKNLVSITSPDMFTGLMQQDLERVTLLNFWASWAHPCEPMKAAVRTWAEKYPDVLFMNIEAEEQPDVAESFDVEAVPTIVLLRGHTLLSKLTGGQPQAVEQALELYAKSTSRGGMHGTSMSNAARSTASASGQCEMQEGDDPSKPHALPSHVDVSGESQQDIEQRCRQLMSRSTVMLFMKGQPGLPRCGFSQKTVSLLREQNVDFDYYDILSDEHVRQTLKVLNEWPTFPQIIVKGELVGGLDILKVCGAHVLLMTLGTYCLWRIPTNDWLIGYLRGRTTVQRQGDREADDVVRVRSMRIRTRHPAPDDDTSVEMR